MVDVETPNTIDLPTVEISLSQEDKDWIDFFNQTLPVIGKLYDGDLESTAKKLETIIGNLINKPMNGIIWNEDKQIFNTTQDDILKALNLLKNKTSSSSNKQERTKILKNMERKYDR